MNNHKALLQSTGNRNCKLFISHLLKRSTVNKSFNVSYFKEIRFYLKQDYTFMKEKKVSM